MSLNSFEGQDKVHPTVTKDGQGRYKINYLDEIGALAELQRLSIVCDEKDEGAKPILIHDVSIPHHMNRFLGIHRELVKQEDERQKK